MAFSVSYELLLPLVAVAVAYSLWKIASIITAPYRSSLRDLPGPTEGSWLYGNVKGLDDIPQSWVDQYGRTFKYSEFLSKDILYTTDTRAMNHILTHSHEYVKPDSEAFFLGEMFGHGLLVVEGEQHRGQRRIMNPAFGPAQIRELTEIFVDKACELRDFWGSQLSAHGPSTIDVTSGLSRATLDVIGLAGFNYSFNALDMNGQTNELNEAFTAMFQMLTHNETIGMQLTMLLKYMIPALRLIPDTFSRSTVRSREVTRRIGMQLIQEKKAEVMQSSSNGKNAGDTLRSRDLLTLLIKANMSTDIPENQRLSDDDVLAQVPTFLIAGHETTSYGTCFALFALAQAPTVQQKLREELLGVPTDRPSMDELNSLPYLDAVVRETLRVHAPVRATVRVPRKDDTIPLSVPFTDRHGRVHDHIRISKDEEIVIHIQHMNTSKELWGHDADEFRPERWEKQPEAIQTIPGVWANLMTFIGGPRACIGYRFALVEMKALLFALVRAYEFNLALPAEDIIKKNIIVQRPYIRGQVDKGSQLPLLIKPYQRL